MKKIVLLVSILVASCASDVNLNKYPSKEFSKVIAYKLASSTSEIQVKGKDTTYLISLTEEIITNNTLTNAVLKEKKLNSSQTTKLLEIFHSKYTYGERAAKCFEPHLGFVFYNDKNEIIAHSTICFGCNWMKTTPDIGAGIFSKRGANRLRKLEKDIFIK